MYRTITANPLLSVQGAYLVIAQEDTKDTKKKRYAIIDSTTLAVRKLFEGEGAKDRLGDEVRLIEAEKAAKEPGSLASMMASVATAKSVTDETVTVVSDSKKR
jgi:hypothetical protein